VSGGGGGGTSEASFEYHSNPQHYPYPSTSDSPGPGGLVPGPSGNGGSSHSQTPTANGPRHLAGGFELPLGQTRAERTRLIGERLSSTDKISLSSPIYSNKVGFSFISVFFFWF
jgi:hypothetical protein